MADRWIQLGSGGCYDFATKEITGRFSMERDIAYPAAGINRYTRHTGLDWAVAIHSVAVARCIEKVMWATSWRPMMGHQFSEGQVEAAAAAGLLHDAHEAVCGDIVTPVAHYIGAGAIEAMKEEIQLAVEERLRVNENKRPINNRALTKMADLAALHVEKQLFLAPEPRPWGYTLPPVEWSQTMYGVITEIIANGEHLDGGEKSFVREYKRLVGEE